MANIVGGLRERIIKDSLFYLVKDGLTSLGWFNPDRDHTPITITATQLSLDIEIPFNTLALSDEGLTGQDVELGSNMVENRWTFYWDLYAEDDDIAIHLTGDIRDLLGGRMHAIGRTEPTLKVWDYTQATPTQVFSCELEDIVTDRPVDYPKPWLKHFRTVHVVVVDTYDDETP